MGRVTSDGSTISRVGTTGCAVSPTKSEPGKWSIRKLKLSKSTPVSPEKKSKSVLSPVADNKVNKFSKSTPVSPEKTIKSAGVPVSTETKTKSTKVPVSPEERIDINLSSVDSLNETIEDESVDTIRTEGAEPFLSTARFSRAHLSRKSDNSYFNPRSSKLFRKKAKEKKSKEAEFEPEYEKEQLENSELAEMDKAMTEKQLCAVKEFRERVADEISEDFSQDQHLRRWLLAARNYNVDKAEEMFRKSQEWRRSYVLPLKDFTPPEVLTRFSPLGFLGRDRHGGQAMLIPQGNIDIRGLLSSCSVADMVKYTIRAVEHQQATMLADTKKMGRVVCQQTCIFDMDGFSLTDFTWMPALEVIKEQMILYEANYPEMLRAGYVINAPRYFSIAWRMVKPLLHAETQKKIRIFGRTGWKEPLLEDVGPDVLPKHWGGDRVDPDGDERCPSVVCLGGKVPVDLYLASRARAARAAMQCIEVAKGDKTVLTFQVAEPNSILSWQVELEQHDIGFSICCGGKVVREVERVSSSQGELVCRTKGEYTVILDNSYSYLRAKTVFHSVTVTPGETKGDCDQLKEKAESQIC